jgi:hypothetical protein
MQRVMRHEDLGLQIAAGTNNFGGEEVRHIWAYDPDRKVYIDASSDFPDNPIIVIPKKRLKEIGYKKEWFETILARRHLSRDI